MKCAFSPGVSIRSRSGLLFCGRHPNVSTGGNLSPSPRVISYKVTQPVSVSLNGLYPGGLNRSHNMSPHNMHSNLHFFKKNKIFKVTSKPHLNGFHAEQDIKF